MLILTRLIYVDAHRGNVSLLTKLLCGGLQAVVLLLIKLRVLLLIRLRGLLLTRLSVAAHKIKCCCSQD